jgi:acetyl-CoA synthetase
MRDYFTAAREFDFEATVADTLAGRLDALNACVECCDRHVGAGRTALIWEGRNGERATWTFEQLQAASARFANLLASRGIGAGDCVSGILPRTPELLITILGTWRAGAVYQPLFTAFGPKAIEHRVHTAGSKLVVTDSLNRGKLDEVEQAPPTLVVGEDFWAELERQADRFEPVMRRADDPFLLMFTSGTTGLAKPLQVPLKAILAFVSYMREAVDLRPEDRFWNLADPGWAYGLYYAVTGPLALGHATTFYEGAFSVESTCRVIREYGITNLAGSPTAFRLLLAARDEVETTIKGRLRVVSSAGEPLTPEVIRWFAEGLGCTIHDHYGQTELGMVLCNHHALQHPVRLGAAGFAMPGHRVVVLDEQQPRTAVWPARHPRAGHGALRRCSGSPAIAAWRPKPSSATTTSVAIRWELNDDGSISFVGRADDVITTSGYRVGPFDVGERADRTSRGDRGGGDRQARPGAYRAGQGLRRAARWPRSRRGPGRGPAAVRAQAPVGACLPARDRVRRRAAQDPERQDPAFSPAQIRKSPRPRRAFSH